MILVSLGGSGAALGQEDGTSTVFVRFHEGTIADPGPASSDTVWLPEDFASDYQGLLARLDEAGVVGLRPIGLSWRHLGQDASSRLVDFSTVYAARLGPIADPDAVVAALSEFEEVEYAEVPGSGEYYVDLSGRYTSDQWWMENTGQTSANCLGSVLYCNEDTDANIPEAWALADSSDALVGILDTGVYSDGLWYPYNPDLTNVFNVALSRDYTGDGMDDTHPDHHGTKVAGIVAGSCENATAYEGVVGYTSPSGWDPLVMFRVGDGIEEDHAIAALDFVSNPDSAAYGKVRILTCSWGIGDPGATFSDALANAYEEDIAIFVAGGNTRILYNNNTPHPTGHIDFTEAVAHVLCDSTRRAYLAGDFIDITAPGGSHIETVDHRSGTYDCFGGTSAASPIAAGIASLIREYCPDLTNNDVYELMECTAEDIGPSGYDEYYGHGLIRADAALEALAAASCTVNVEAVASSNVALVDTLTMAIKNIPIRTSTTNWVKVYKVEGTVSLVPQGEGRVISCVWTRSRDCETVRGPDDLYELDDYAHPANIPYFNGKRLGKWACVEHTSGSMYTAHGYTYHIYDDSSEQQDRGWYPFNPYLNPPNPMFTVAYIDEDDAKRLPIAESPAAQGPSVSLAAGWLKLELPAPSSIGIKAYDVLGRVALDLGIQRIAAGKQVWDMGEQLKMRGLTSGVYLVRVEAAGRVYSGKALVLR